MLSSDKAILARRHAAFRTAGDFQDGNEDQSEVSEASDGNLHEFFVSAEWCEEDASHELLRDHYAVANEVQTLMIGNSL